MREQGPHVGDPTLIIERIWTGNSWRNYNYLVGCPETGEALAIDPIDHKKCLELAKRRGWSIRAVLNTHEHYDHTAGNDVVIAATGARLLAHHNAKPNIRNMDVGLAAGDIVRVGKAVEFEVLNTPGHTFAHVCLLSRTDTKLLICGDTLFNAGAGNCHNGGDPEILYSTFVDQLARLPDETLVYPGHDYINNNLEFTLDREPENTHARILADELRGSDPATMRVTTIGLEKEINTFFRLQNPEIIRGLRQIYADLPDHPDSKAVFLRLREMRNKWKVRW